MLNTYLNDPVTNLVLVVEEQVPVHHQQKHHLLPMKQHKNIISPHEHTQQKESQHSDHRLNIYKHN